jgi:hypothetical protein
LHACAQPRAASSRCDHSINMHALPRVAHCMSCTLAPASCRPAILLQSLHLTHRCSNARDTHTLRLCHQKCNHLIAVHSFRLAALQKKQSTSKTMCVCRFRCSATVPRSSLRAVTGTRSRTHSSSTRALSSTGRFWQSPLQCQATSSQRAGQGHKPSLQGRTLQRK